MDKQYWIDDETVTRREFIEQWKRVRSYNRHARIVRNVGARSRSSHYHIRET